MPTTVTTAVFRRRPVVWSAGVLLAAALTMTGCQVTKQDAGLATGAVLGGLAGSQVGSGSGRIVAAVAGAAAGAWLGSAIGKYLDEQDRERMAEATQESAVTGDAQTWRNPNTGVHGRTRVVDRDVRQRATAVPVRGDRVATVPPLDYIGERYRVTTAANVRGGPGTDYVIVDGLRAGSTVGVVGKVQTAPWYMVARAGIGEGFVHTSLLEPLGQRDQPATEETRTQDNVTMADVTARRDCRTVEQVVVLQGGEEKRERVTACEGPNGWEVI